MYAVVDVRTACWLTEPGVLAPSVKSMAVGENRQTAALPFTTRGPGPIVTEFPLAVDVLAYCNMVFRFLRLVLLRSARVLIPRRLRLGARRDRRASFRLPRPFR